MKILTRYLLKEFLVPLFYCMTGFLSIYVLFDLFGSFSRMLEARLPIGVAARYFCGYISPYYHYIVPAALMLATLYTMWRLCRHSEIIAMRASGVSLITIVKPLLAVSILMASSVVYVNEVYMPETVHWASLMKNCYFDRTKFSRGDNIVFRNAAEGRTWNIDKMLDDSANVLQNVRVTVDRPGNGPRLMSIEAKCARFLDGEWWFFDSSVQHYDANGQEIATPTPEADALKVRCFGHFAETPTDFMMQNRPWKFNSIRERLRYLETHSNLDELSRKECLYDIFSQIMSPLACLLITLIAIPAGIATGRQSVFKGIIGALSMYFAFYGVVIAFMVIAKNGWCNPILGAVLPFVLFLAVGIRAFIRQR